MKGRARAVGPLMLSLALLLGLTPAMAGPNTGDHDLDEVMKTDTESTPGLLFVQGRLRPDGAGAYQKYLQGTGPLLAEYGGTVSSVGAGVASAHADEPWPINAVLTFPSVQAAEGFLADPRYLELKTTYRDAAYETLHLSLVAGRPPRIDKPRTPRDVAEEAFQHFRHGLATGEWTGFLDRLDEDFEFRFPMGRYQGEHRGRAKAEAFFNYVSSAFPGGLQITEIEAITGNGPRVVFEFADVGELRGEPYKNHIAIALEVCGEKICAYREYFGLVGPPPSDGGGS